MIVIANVLTLTLCVIAGMFVGSTIHVKLGAIDDSLGGIVGGVLGLVVVYPIIAFWIGLG